MPDFAALLSKPAGEAPRPKVLPGGTYGGVIKSKQMGESAQKKTPYVQFNLGITSPPSDMDASELEGIELDSKQLRCTYYLTDDSMYRLDEALEALGVDMGGPGNRRPYGELLEEVVGLPCGLIVTQRVIEGREDPVNDVSKLVAPE